jgi:hypothetical protein
VALAGSIVVLLLARTAAAGVTLVFQSSDGTSSTWYGEGTRARLQSWTGDDPDRGLIVDLATNDIIIVDDAAQAYFDFSHYLERARKKLAPLRQELRRRVRAEPAEAPTAYVDGHEKRTVRSFSCDVYAGFKDGRVVEEVCVVPWDSPAVGPKKDYAFMDLVFEVMRAQLMGEHGRVRAPPTPEYALPGLAVSRQVIKADRSRGESTEILSIKRGAVPAVLLSVPASYHEDEGLPDRAPSRLPDREPSRLPDRAASRPSPPSAPSAASEGGPPGGIGGGVWGVVVLLLLGMGMVILMIHAWVLHLAAKFLLDEPRYMDAFIATFVVWVLGIPLELFTPQLLAVPASLLASYGGLRLAYRASPGRTVALFLVSTFLWLVIAALFVAPMIVRAHLK